MNRFLKSHYLTALLVALDALAFAAVWFGSYKVRDALGDWGVLTRPINPVAPYLLALPVYLALWLACEWHYGLFDHRGKITGLNQLSRILRAFIAGGVGSLALAYLFKQWDIGRSVLLVSAGGFAVWLYLSRSALRAWKHRQVRVGHGATGVLIIGVGRTAQRVMDRLVKHPEGGYRMLGFVDPHPRRRAAVVAGMPVLGRTDDIVAIIRANPVDEVFLAVPKMPQNEMMNLIVRCEDLGVQFKVVSNLFEVITSDVKVDVIDEVPVVHLRNAQLPLTQRALKRGLDMVVSAALLAVSGIPMLVIAALVRMDSERARPFPPGADGEGGQALHDAQVPHHAPLGRPVRNCADRRGRPAHHAHGVMAATVQLRRVSPAHQCAVGSHEHGGPAPGDAISGGTL